MPKRRKSNLSRSADIKRRKKAASLRKNYSAESSISSSINKNELPRCSKSIPDSTVSNNNELPCCSKSLSASSENSQIHTTEVIAGVRSLSETETQFINVRNEESDDQSDYLELLQAQYEAYGIDREISGESDVEVTAVSSTSIITTRLTKKQKKQQRRIKRRRQPAGRDALGKTVQPAVVGKMEIKCKHCNALHFPGEVPSGEKIENGSSSFSSCCKKGRACLEPIKDPPPLLSELLSGTHDLSSHFMTDIRHYNSSLAFASMVANTVDFKTPGPYSYKIHGQVYHYSGCLEPSNSSEAAYAQLYLMDSDMATEIRMHNNAFKLRDHLLSALAAEIAAVNTIADSFKMMKAVVDDEELRFPDAPRDVMMVFDLNPSLNPKLYNVPVSNEVAAVFVAPDGQVPTNRGIVVHRKDNRIRKMPIISPFVDPMTYPLFFPHAEPGWHPNMKMAGHGSKRLTMHSLYAHRFFYRTGSTIHRGGKLFQQFLVDSFCKIEDNNLSYIRMNQNKFRVESYMGLMDYLENEAMQSNARVGRKVILPSSFNGGPRNMAQHYQDSLSMVAKFGKPDAFITFTCNPNCEEITDSLLPGQQPHDRPDIGSRVFKLKLDLLKKDLVKKRVLGIPAAHIGVIEFQKRGLPHAHILLTFRDDYKMMTPDDIDQLVSAEIPSAETDPQLKEYVLQHMIHRPCDDLRHNRPCIEDNKCKKGFPKKLCQVTDDHEDGFPLYRRRGRETGVIRGDIEVGDEWVVPYNPYLLKRYNAHINVEICASIKSIKYLYKYIFKGHDAASLIFTPASGDQTFLNYDEVEHHLEARYVGSPEAAWRISKNPIQFKSHSVTVFPLLMSHAPIISSL